MPTGINPFYNSSTVTGYHCNEYAIAPISPSGNKYTIRLHSICDSLIARTPLLRAVAQVTQVR